MKAIKIFTLGLCCCLAGGCESLRFYKQAALGQLSLLQQAEDVDALVTDPSTPQGLRQRLETVQGILQFAEQQLNLPVGDRYQRYVGLEQDYVVWNVFVAPPLVMNSVQWCYPIVGCAPYRGYFDQADAVALAANYANQGFDTYVAGVSAYSTLGWFKDPLLSSFVFYSEPALTNLLFHELAHSKVWVNNDVAFNESFASFVGLQGTRQWLSLGRDQSSEPLLRWRRGQVQWQQFKTFALAAKADLTSLYEDQTGSDAERMQQSRERRDELRCRINMLKEDRCPVYRRLHQMKQLVALHEPQVYRLGMYCEELSQRMALVKDSLHVEKVRTRWIHEWMTRLDERATHLWHLAGWDDRVSFHGGKMYRDGVQQSCSRGEDIRCTCVFFLALRGNRLQVPCFTLKDVDVFLDEPGKRGLEKIIQHWCDENPRRTCWWISRDTEGDINMDRVYM